MTENEVFEHIGDLAGDYKCFDEKISHQESLILCNLIEEVQQYRAIGTVEEFKTLKEKKNVLPIATIKISKEDMQKMVDEKVAQIDLDIQEIRAKAIDEMLEELQEVIDEHGERYVMMYMKERAKQLKAGGINE